MKRAIIIVLDSVGIGELPDAADFGDVGSNTLVNIKKVRPQTSLPNLCALGLGDIQGKDISLLGEVAAPKGCYGKMAERSIGKDTTTGHWEMAGIITKRPFPTFTETGFPKEVMDAFEAAIGTKTLGNYAESGTVIIQDLGVEHMKTGYPIVYTSADSVFQIAAHEDSPEYVDKSVLIVKDILEFAPGTIVELNKIAGEPIDILVNGKNVAKGEVVVIEESFGVRITEIIKDR